MNAAAHTICFKSPNIHVSGLWDKTGVLRENTHVLEENTPHRLVSRPTTVPFQFFLFSGGRKTQTNSTTSRGELFLPFYVDKAGKRLSSVLRHLSDLSQPGSGSRVLMQQNAPAYVVPWLCLHIWTGTAFNRSVG